ncbi:hypothetical protein DV737_g4592, partial [Chaetothyriales sp. CBS 132003]
MSSALPTPPADSASEWGPAEGHSNLHEVKLGAEVAGSKAGGVIELGERQSPASVDQLKIKPALPSLEAAKPRAHVTEVAGAVDNRPKNGGDSNSATSLDSGYATAPSQNFPDVGTHTFINSTKGQKVKGRPLSRAIRQAHNANRVRNVANTYPRKQPFKAQIMFDGYPSEDQPLREGATLWEICQEYPNHLTGKVLEGFVQKEWSANELCACLKDDARKVLTDRPGKDKTMVFQKRLERIKKDLMAKDEFDQLMNGPEIRPDGRPTWVKRGNVRRK